MNTMQDTTTSVRLFGKCKNCKTKIVATRPAGFSYWDYETCPSCDGMATLVVVDGTPGKRPCGSWCTEGSGTTCRCQCGGANHGRDLPGADGTAWAGH